MAENGQLPDWLIELRDQQIMEQEQGLVPEVESLQEQVARGAFVEEPEPAVKPVFAEEPAVEFEEPLYQPEPEPEPEPEPAEPTDVLEDLREQMMLAEEEFEPRQRRSFSFTSTSSFSQSAQGFSQTLMALQPAQRLLLAVLLFLNVAICGCMGLVMVGRVALPF
jgi:hypothetical protein